MSTIRTLFVVSLVVVALLPAGAAPVAADGCDFPVTSTDATGTTVTVTERPDSIVTLGPSAAQTLYEIDAWDRVVGVTDNADYLPGADEKTQMGNPYFEASAVTERTIAASPDLVLVPNAYRNSVQVDTLRQAGLTVYVFEDASDLDDVVEKTRLTGDLVGSCEAGDETADKMKTQLDIVRDTLRDERTPRVFYDLGGDYTAGEGTFVNSILTTAGLENVAANNYATLENGYRFNNRQYYQISKEKLVVVDPEWYVMSDEAFDDASVPAGPNGELTGTTAYQESNGILLDANQINQPAPHTIDAILDIVRVVHPEAYEELRDRLDHPGDLGGTKQVRSSTLADGSVRLEAQNLGRERQVNFALPARANATAQLQRLNVSLATLNPSFTVDLRYLADGEGRELNGTHAFSRFSLETNGLPDEDVDRLRFRFDVNESVLSARNASTENVTLYRHNGTAWSALDTRIVDETNGTVVFEATSPGASTFVVGVPETDEARAVTATPTPQPTPTVVTDSSTPTPQPSSTTASTPSTTPATTDTSAPGFGVLVVVAAAALATLASRTRVGEKK